MLFLWESNVNTGIKDTTLPQTENTTQPLDVKLIPFSMVSLSCIYATLFLCLTAIGNSTHTAQKIILLFDTLDSRKYYVIYYCSNNKHFIIIYKLY